MRFIKILKRNFKEVVSVKVQNNEDLWVLSKIINKGDVVGKKDFRTLQKSDKGEKKRVYLKISVEKVEYLEDSDVLKVLGSIVYGPDEVSHGHHSFNVKINDVLDIEKEWKASEINLLMDSSRVKGIRVLLIVLDDRDATIALVNERNVKILMDLKGNKGKMYDASESNELSREIVSVMEEWKDKVERFILAGPGFAKTNLYNELPKELKGRTITGDTSVTGQTGVNEAIKRGLIDKVLEDAKISEETDLVERFLVELSKDSNLITYGLEHIKKAVYLGAVEILLVSDKLLRKKEIEDLIEKSKGIRAKVYIINSSHEAGEKLYMLGGLAAFLRYKVE